MQDTKDSRILSPSEIQIKADFKNIKFTLKKIEKKYNPQNDNLHFNAIQKADLNLFSELLKLTHDGLRKVNRNRDFFLKNSLYADDMFWYDLFLMVSSASIGIQKNKNQKEIPARIITGIVDNLISISKYSTENGGDITKRNYEALANTLIAFYNKDLIDKVHKKRELMSSGPIRDFLDWTLSVDEENINDERRRNVASFQEAFVKNLVAILQKHPLLTTIKTKEQLEQQIHQILCDHIKNTPSISIEKLEDIIFTHGKTKTEKDNWTRSKIHQNIIVYGCSNSSDIFIKHPHLGTIYVELQLSKKMAGITSSTLPGDLQRSIGQSIIASLNHSYVICLIVCEKDIAVKENDYSDKLREILWINHKIALIVRSFSLQLASGKPGGKRREKHHSGVSGKTDLLDSSKQKEIRL